MKRIKRVDVMMERNGKAHKMASFKTIKGAQAYMNDLRTACIITAASSRIIKHLVSILQR